MTRLRYVLISLLISVSAPATDLAPPALPSACKGFVFSDLSYQQWCNVYNSKNCFLYNWCATLVHSTRCGDFSDLINLTEDEMDTVRDACESKTTFWEMVKCIESNLRSLMAAERGTRFFCRHYAAAMDELLKELAGPLDPTAKFSAEALATHLANRIVWNCQIYIVDITNRPGELIYVGRENGCTLDSTPLPSAPNTPPTTTTTITPTATAPTTKTSSPRL